MAGEMWLRSLVALCSPGCHGCLAPNLWVVLFAGVMGADLGGVGNLEVLWGTEKGNGPWSIFSGIFKSWQVLGKEDPLSAIQREEKNGRECSRRDQVEKSLPLQNWALREAVDVWGSSVVTGKQSSWGHSAVTPDAIKGSFCVHTLHIYNTLKAPKHF